MRNFRKSMTLPPPSVQKQENNHSQKTKLIPSLAPPLPSTNSRTPQRLHNHKLLLNQSSKNNSKKKQNQRHQRKKKDKTHIKTKTPAPTPVAFSQPKQLAKTKSLLKKYNPQIQNKLKP
uniref:Uncharacterized protein n=1 Tax=Rhodosorus marinus TaxID=101924 RepID=A0A7S0G2M5_9RHOD